ncbi:MAG: SUMF1/EgtB/PvdO family nonheme iron enzyme [bacterium]|nr:SUMF1/EgtB/PvdO family nonheme iron enzyme [bacterium]
MKHKNMCKRIVDGVMLLLLPVLMAEILTGQQFHEWIGTGMLLLFIAHHILNLAWIKNIFKGKYTPSRSLGTMINLLLLCCMATLAVSGIMMSGFVFRFLRISGGMVLARRLHLFASHWGMILMSAHLGMHMDMIMGMGRKLFRISGKNAARTWILRSLTAGLSIYGIVVFFTQNMPDYLFLKTAFVFFDDQKGAGLVLAEYAAMIWLFAALAHYLNRLLRVAAAKSEGKAWKAAAFLIPLFICIAAVFGINQGQQTFPGQSGSFAGQPDETNQAQGEAGSPAAREPSSQEPVQPQPEQSVQAGDGFVLVSGGTFVMGSPETESWRSEDETQHTVTVSDFYISPFELTQREYQEVAGENPSSFTGEDLPVENISWLDAVAFCNAKSEAEGLTSVYRIDEESITWDRTANGYRLPTEAEWEYACRAGTATPFNTETSISADECNYYGHYPYDIEQNYFTQGNLDTKPGQYRQTTVAVGSFAPNGYGLYDMHGNVSEWVWDYYGAYGTEEQTDPTGAASGTLRVYWGGGWNDFAKNMRSAYRATFAEDKGSFNIGIRLVRNAVSGTGSIVSAVLSDTISSYPGAADAGGKVLIAFFSWGGNTRGIAKEIQSQTGADLFEIEPVNPYSNDYNTVLDEAQRDQNEQARPELANHVEDMDEYDTIILGYPNWWASIPMPIASFLEEYDFSGKTIIPFCSHGGGRFGQSLTAIAKLAPDAAMGEALSVHYSGGSGLPGDVEEWLKLNGITE